MGLDSHGISHGISHRISWGHFGESFSGLLQALALCALFSTIKAGSAEHIPRRLSRQKKKPRRVSIRTPHNLPRRLMFPVSWLELIGFICIYCLVVELQYSSFSIVLLVMLLFDQWWMICGV
jgi:hypothetical protein